MICVHAWFNGGRHTKNFLRSFPMATKLYRRNTLYGFPSPTVLEAPAPIIAERDPEATDQGFLGQLWINKATASAFICAQENAGAYTWTTSPSGAGFENALQVDPGNVEITAGNLDVVAGDITLGGDLDVGVNAIVRGDLAVLGAFTATGGPATFDAIEVQGEVDIDTNNNNFTVVVGTGDINIGADAADHATVLGSETGASPMLIQSGTDGMGLRTAGNLAFAAADGAGLALGDSTVEQHAFVGSETGASSTTIKAGTGALYFETAGLTTSEFYRTTVAHPTAATTINVNVGQAVFTGFTTAAAASQVFTINNALITDREPVFVTVSRANVGGGDVLLQVLGVHQAAGVLTVEIGNTGGDALADDLFINFWVMAP